MLPLTYGGPHLLPQYFTPSGSSMATPLVAGSLASLLERQPALTPNAVKAILMTSKPTLDLALSGLSDQSGQNSVVWRDDAVWGDDVVWGDRTFQLDLLIRALGE